MSFILDALKKSENDRQRQTTPGLFEVKVAPPKARFPIWAVGLGLLLGINLLVLVGLLVRDGRAERNPAQAVADAPAQSASNVGSSTQLPSAPASTPGQTQVATVTVTVPTSVTPNVTVTPGSAPSSVVPEDMGGVVARSAAPPLVEEPVLSDQDEPIAPDFNPADYAPAVAPSTATQGAQAAANRLPSRDDVVTGGGPAIPAMRLDLHVYAANPAERFVFINMRKLREGESLPDGTRIESITPTGAVVSYRGTRFTLQSD
jgi:general secretion pathway protein B